MSSQHSPRVYLQAPGELVKKKKQIKLMHIQPGKPAQNAYIERFNRTFREDVLDAYLFDDLEEVRLIAEHWLEDYNTIHPHEALQGLSPRTMQKPHPK